MKDIQDFDFNKLMEAISQLTEKVDKLENGKGHSEEQQNATETFDINAGTGKTRLERSIETFLGLEIPDLSAAYTAIRRAIEEYCKFEKGFDLNDVFLPEGTKRFEKFKAAGIEPDRIELLNKIFLEGNKYTHGNNIEFMSANAIKEQKELIREYVQKLNEWGMAEVDKENGKLRFCRSQDKRLQEKLDNGEFDANSEQFQSKLNFYFKRMNEFMNDYRVDINTVDIRFKNKQNVYDYLLDKKLKKGVGALSVGDKERLFLLHKKQAEEGSFDDCLWMSAYYWMAKNTQKVVEYYKLAMSVNDAENKIHQSSNDIRRRAGYDLYEAKEYTAALKWIDNIEDDIDAAILAGDCYFCENNVEEAIRQYRRVDAASLRGDDRKKLVAESAYEIEPDVALRYYIFCSTADSDPKLIKRIGDCYLNLNNIPNAIRLYEKVLSLSYDFSLRKQIVEKITDDRISFNRIKTAIKVQGDKTVVVFANAFWGCGMEKHAIECYNECNPQYIFPDRQREIGNYYLQKGDCHTAFSWCLRYVEQNGNYASAKSIAQQFETRKHFAEAAKLYEFCASNSNDPSISDWLGKYYEQKKIPVKAAYWYEKYYDISKNKSKDILLHIIQLYMQAGKKNEAIRCKGTLGNLFFDKGDIESAILLYEEYIEVFPNDESIALRLAEYYYYHGRYQDAGKMLSSCAGAKVLVHKGFALAVNGQLFIAYNQHLIPVKKQMVDKLQIKHIFLSNKEGATLYLNSWAPEELPREIVLFDKLHEKDVVVQTLKEQFPKKEKSIKRVQKTNTKGRMILEKCFNFKTRMLLIAILFIFIATRVGLGEVGGFWKWTGFFIVSFTVLFGMYQANKMYDKKVSGAICWITIAIEYLIKVISDYRHDIVSKNCSFVIEGKADDVHASLAFLGAILLEPIPAVILIIIIGSYLDAHEPMRIFSGIKLFEGRRVKTKGNPLINIVILTVGLLGIAAMIFNSEVCYHFSKRMYFIQAVLIGVLTFEVSMGIARIKHEVISLWGNIFMWGSLIVQYAIHLCFQAHRWLDGPVYIGDFIAEGVLPVVIVGVVCWVINILLQKYKKGRK